MLAKVRKRSAAIDHYVDLIPARFYLSSDTQEVLDARRCGDPKQAQSTSRIVAAAAVAQHGSTEGAGEQGSSGTAASSMPMTKAAKRRQQRRGGKAATGSSTSLSSNANSRSELHEKLERRIAELKEERRRRQSEKDRAKAASSKVVAASGERPDKETKVPTEDTGAEIGRLTFEPNSATVPFEATVGRRGEKVRRLRAELRKQEADVDKLRKAENEGRGDEFRNEMALQKALKRARGEKVHDDSAKLRKAQKALEVKRKKGKEKWDALKNQEKQSREDKQQKRKENLAKPRGKKRKLRSGFEGQRGGSFINSDK